MRNQAHPQAILQRAWKTHRLDALRSIVEQTIATLQASAAGSHANDPDQVALSACCDEMRDGCGLPLVGGAERGSAIDHAQEDADWQRRFDEALETYRSLAGVALQNALAAAQLEAASPPTEPPADG